MKFGEIIKEICKDRVVACGAFIAIALCVSSMARCASVAIMSEQERLKERDKARYEMIGESNKAFHSSNR